MEHHAIPEQVLIEHQTLAYVTSALRATIGWKFAGTNLTRKLSSLIFVGESFQRHLERLLALVEEEGYMMAVLTARPEFHDEVSSLRGEHDQFRAQLASLLNQVRAVEPTDHLGFAKVSDELLALLTKLDDHSQRETDLLQQALLQDEGGEG